MSVDTRAIMDALRAAFAGVPGEEHGPVLETFLHHQRPDAAADMLYGFVQAHHDEIARLVASKDDSVRHLAAYALRFSRDVRSVEPLIALLDNQLDFFDHDYCYESLRELGAIAHERLYEIAANDGGERAVQAVQALGQSRVSASVWLGRLAQMDRLPDGFFIAYANLNDPAGLPDLERGLWHPDPEMRDDAVGAAYSLLKSAREQAHPALDQIDRDRWSERLAELFEDDEFDASDSWIVECLGFLRSRRHLPFLVALLDDEEVASDAVEAIGWYQSDDTRRMLIELLESDDVSKACAAAVQLERDPGCPVSITGRVAEVMWRGIVELPGNSVWCDAKDAYCADAERRRWVIEQIAVGDGQVESPALRAVSSYVNRHRPDRTIDVVLADCEPERAQVVRQELDTLAARRMPPPRE